jgi:hypothetical protein
MGESRWALRLCVYVRMCKRGEKESVVAQIKKKCYSTSKEDEVESRGVSVFEILSFSDSILGSKHEVKPLL